MHREQKTLKTSSAKMPPKHEKAVFREGLKTAYLISGQHYPKLSLGDKSGRTAVGRIAVNLIITRRKNRTAAAR